MSLRVNSVYFMNSIDKIIFVMEKCGDFFEVRTNS
jgi:hypothetical protein